MTHAARSDSASEGDFLNRRSALSILLLGVILAGCNSVSEVPDPAPSKFTFEQHEVITGSANRQTIVPGFFLSGAIADLAVVNLDEDAHRLRIYAFDDDTWTPAVDVTLRRDVSFVDVANIGGRDRLITYGSGHLNWFDPESLTERELVAVVCDFKPPDRDDVLHVDVTRDVNDDGLDDLILPDLHGFWVFVQTSDGAFADRVKIGPSSGMDRVYGADGYRYDPWSYGRVHEMDYNRDGRSDLVFWNEDHFEVHLQDERGRFTPAARTFTTEVAFDSDEIASLVAPEGVRRRRRDHQPTGDLTGRVLYSLGDRNDDGVADLVIFSLQGESLWRMHSTYEVHFGTPTPDGGTVFAPEIGTAIDSDGIPFSLEQHEVAHDGGVDVAFTTIKPRFFKAIGMIIASLLTDSASLDLEWYRADGGSYPDQPNARRKIKCRVTKETGGKTLFPPVLVGDVNGDDRADLLVGRSGKELRVFLGIEGPELFVRKPQKVAVTMPDDEEYTWLADLNRDGTQDIVMHHPSNTEPNRVTLLIAR